MMQPEYERDLGDEFVTYHSVINPLKGETLLGDVQGTPVVEGSRFALATTDQRGTAYIEPYSFDTIYSVKLFFESISARSKALIEKSFDVLRINLLPAESQDKLLHMVVSLCTDAGDKEVMKLIFDLWTTVYPDTERIPIYITLLYDNVYTLDELLFVFDVFDELTFINAIDSLAGAVDSDVTVAAADKLINMYMPDEENTFRCAAAIAREKSNVRLEEFMMNRVALVSAYADIPSWVKTFMDGDEVPDEDQIVEIIASSEFNDSTAFNQWEQVVAASKTNLSEHGLSIMDNVKTEETMKELLIISDEEFNKVLFGSLGIGEISDDDVDNDILLFRLLGPKNPVRDQEIDTQEYGGERMFLSVANEYGDGDGNFDDVEEHDSIPWFVWFHGHCDSCKKRIREYWHAVRKPEPYGGWIGAYCSWECVTKESENDVLFTIDIFSEQMGRIGIQDRLL